MRHFAVDVIDEVELARQATTDLANQLRGQLRAERKAERADARAERKAKVQAHFDELKTMRAEHNAAVAAAKEAGLA